MREFNWTRFIFRYIAYGRRTNKINQTWTIISIFGWTKWQFYALSNRLFFLSRHLISSSVPVPIPVQLTNAWYRLFWLLWTKLTERSDFLWFMKFPSNILFHWNNNRFEAVGKLFSWKCNDLTHLGLWPVKKWAPKCKREKCVRKQISMLCNYSILLSALSVLRLSTYFITVVNCHFKINSKQKQIQATLWMNSCSWMSHMHAQWKTFKSSA